jgi:hypothetical protein
LRVPEITSAIRTNQHHLESRRSSASPRVSRTASLP